MANSFVIQTVQEGQRNLVVKLTGVLDTSNLASTVAINLTGYNCGGTAPTPTLCRIDHIDYSITDQLEVQLLWDGATPAVIMPIAGRGRMSFWNHGGLQNNAVTPTGNILVQTTGWTSGVQVFSVILEMVKQGPNL